MEIHKNRKTPEGFRDFKIITVNKKAITACIIAAISWGTVFIFGQIAVKDGYHPVVISFLRFIFASLFLGLYQFFTEKRIFLSLRDILQFLVLGGTGIFGMNVFIFYSLKMTDSTITSLLMNANGFIIAILSFFFLKEKINIVEIIGLIIGFTGCYFIFFQGKVGNIFPSQVFGNTLAVLAAFCWAFYSVWGKKTKLIEKYGAVLSTLWASVFGSVMLGFLIMMAKIPFNLDAKCIFIGFYLGIIPAGIGFTLWFYSINKLKTIIPGIIQFLAPLTTAVLAVVWLNQVISFSTVFGGILIVTGVLFSLRKR